jgi:hypothetical protein
MATVQRVNIELFRFFEQPTLSLVPYGTSVMLKKSKTQKNTLDRIGAHRHALTSCHLKQNVKKKRDTGAGPLDGLTGCKCVRCTGEWGERGAGWLQSFLRII